MPSAIPPRPMEFDSSWCPVCDRQIQPKRTQVPIVPQSHQPPSSPAPPPSSPQSDPAKQTMKRTRTATRSKQGLVQGTGRLKPNGTIKRADSQPPSDQKPAQPVKYRTVIDQGPTPLYCSDECRVADSVHRGLPHNYNPERDGPLSHRALPFDANSDSNSSNSSLSSDLPSPVLPSPPHISPSVAKLAAHYKFDLPTTAPVCDDSSSEPEYYPLEYNTGVMMAGKLIQSMCPKPAKQEPSYRGIRQPPKERKPVPGWTDGSNAWRSTVYGFSTPKTTPESLEDSKAYRGFVASPHRTSHPVYSTVTTESKAPTPTSARSALSTGSLPSTTNDMLSKFSQSLSRRSESRSTLYPATSPASSPAFPATAPAAPHRRERSIVKPGAEGKLLVPDVKLKVGSGSSASLSSAWSGTLSSTASSRRSMRSPLSAASCDGESSDEDGSTQRCDSAASLPPVNRRPVVETRSWSYDNLKTYPIMQLPPKREKRIEKRIVDGTEVDVEVEVIVEQPRKRLFLFPPSTRA